jgi:dTDP-4-dehydrorhamnose reductase
MNLIIGSSGKIGTYYKFFSKLKNNIYTSHNKNVKNVLKFDLAKDNILDLYKKYNFRNAVLFSSISNPEYCEKNKRLSYKINIKYTKKIIDFLVKKNIYFIFFSTEYVYFGKKKIIYNEDSQTNSKQLYANQKIEIEKYIYKKKYINFSILRLSKTFGDQIKDSTLFSSTLSSYLNGQKIFYIASDQFFKPLFVKDLVKIIDIFLKKNIKGVYNVCGNKYTSRFNLIKFFFKYKKIKDVKLYKISINDIKNNIFYPKYLNLDNTKIKKVTKFNFTKIKDVYKKLCINL